MSAYGKASNARSLLEMSLEFSLFVLEPLVLDLGILQLLGHREGGLVQEQELAAVAPVAQASAVAGSQTQVVLEDKLSCNSDRLLPRRRVVFNSHSFGLSAQTVVVSPLESDVHPNEDPLAQRPKYLSCRNSNHLQRC